ncbi:FAD-dependent oxidoreductase [Marinobacter sp.]|uniref:NAD(P)/FAD-dependent oxidoreductase n=1 Tax=Marinobacter sp. TaxID=50741 RepID=UPI00260F8698|nr:FAD-dependent oxidoreductase [Marinobacter sp.]
MTKNETYIIVGGGQAGGQAAISLRACGFQGRIILVGEEKLVPYERPPLSKTYLTNETAERTEFRPLQTYLDAQVDCRLGMRATGLDSARKLLTLEDGSELHWDKLLLATGGTPRRLPHAKGPVYYLRTEDDALALRNPMRAAKKVVVVGGGVIGLETAASARQLGAEVVVVEPAERVMARMIPAEISRVIEQIHRDHQVDLRLGSSAHAVEETADGRALVYLSDRTLKADLVIVGIGIVPNTQLAVDAGLEVNNGILVNTSCQTSHPDIYAVGDVANTDSERYGQKIRIESWQNASKQAEVAARAMCGENVVFDELPWFWSDQFDINLQVAGLPHLANETLFRGGHDPAIGVTAVHLRDKKLIAVTTLNNGREMSVARRMLTRGITPDVDALCNPDLPLKHFLKAVSAD